MEHLSAGARDTFYFAARLALARKHATGPRILVLDEPFATLDRERERRMVGLLRDFQKEADWQIVLLTKEPELKEMMAEQCSATTVELGCSSAADG